MALPGGPLQSGEPECVLQGETVQIGGDEQCEVSASTQQPGGVFSIKEPEGEVEHFVGEVEEEHCGGGGVGGEGKEWRGRSGGVEEWRWRWRWMELMELKGGGVICMARDESTSRRLPGRQVSSSAISLEQLQDKQSL